MPLLLLLSGLFVPATLARKGTGNFLRGRLLRLGLPFTVAELTIVPLAYYPSFIQAGGTPGFGGFWVTTVTVGPWPSGPPWFIAILLLFDVALVLVPGPLLRPLRRAWPDYPTPGRCFAVLLGGSTILYLPLLLHVGPARWFSFGPVAIQGSRIGLYAAYFVAGAALGAGGNPSLRCSGEAIARRWAGWALLAILTGTTLVLVGAMRSVASRDLPTWLALELSGIAVAAFCAAACFALPALFLRFGAGLREPWDSLAANSFAIYLLHYPAVTWLQYGLLSMPVAGWMKGLITFTVALGASWSGAAALRRSQRWVV